MKHITFYNWLVNSEANTQLRKGEVCSDCGSCGFIGFNKESDQYGNAIECSWCGDDDKLEELRQEYEAQKEKDAKLMAQKS